MASSEVPTLEQVYELLKSLTDYVMNEVATRRELVSLEARLSKVERRLDEKADKKDVERIYTILDGVVHRLDDLQIEQRATSAAVARLESELTKRVERLEKHVGLVREAVARYGKGEGD